MHFLILFSGGQTGCHTRSFEVTFLIQGSQGNDVFNQARIRLENPYRSGKYKNTNRGGHKTIKIQVCLHS